MFRRYRGLSLIDFFIIALLVGAVVGVLFSRYDDFSCRSMQSEAKFSLAQVHAAQKLYHAEHDGYAPLIVLIDEEKRVVVSQKYYDFSEVQGPTQDSFRIQALGREGTLVAGDVWQVDENNNIVNKNEIVKINDTKNPRQIRLAHPARHARRAG